MVSYHPLVLPFPGSLTITVDPYCLNALRIVNVVLVAIIRKGSDEQSYTEINLVCIPQRKKVTSPWRRLSMNVKSQWRQLLHNLKLIETKVNIGTSLDQQLMHVASCVVTKSPQRRK